MSKNLNIKEINRQKYSKKQGLGFEERQSFHKSSKSSIKKLTK